MKKRPSDKLKREAVEALSNSVASVVFDFMKTMMKPEEMREESEGAGVSFFDIYSAVDASRVLAPLYTAGPNSWVSVFTNALNCAAYGAGVYLDSEHRKHGGFSSDELKEIAAYAVTCAFSD